MHATRFVYIMNHQTAAPYMLRTPAASASRVLRAKVDGAISSDGYPTILALIVTVWFVACV